MLALTSFHALGRFIAQGESVAASDPIVKAFPSLFAPDPDAPTLVRPESTGKTVTRPARKATARKATD